MQWTNKNISVTFFADRLVMWHHMKAKQADLIMLINQDAQKYSELFLLHCGAGKEMKFSWQTTDSMMVPVCRNLGCRWIYVSTWSKRSFGII